MAQINRLRESNITNGSLIDADDLNVEFNQLLSESNGQDTRLTAIESGATTLTGIKTFTSNPKTNGIDERSAGSGVTVDGVLLKDGFIQVAETAGFAPSANGQIGYDSTTNRLLTRINGQTATLGGFPKGYIEGPAVVYKDATTVTIKAGLKLRSDDNTDDIEFTADQDVALNVSGANGLANGSEASSTWYYLWAIKNSTTGAVAGLLSTSSTAPTLPSGYDKKRLVRIAIRNDGSSNIIPFYVMSGWPLRPQIRYKVQHSNPTVLAGSTNILNVATAASTISTSWTTASLSSFVPPLARETVLRCYRNNVSGFGALALRESSSESYYSIAAYGATNLKDELPITLTATQQFDWGRLSGASTDTFTIDVAGYTITEVAN